MQKKDDSNLLKPATAVEDFLDTLLQESTQRAATEKPVRLKSRLVLMPDLETIAEPELIEPDLEVETESKPADIVISAIEELPKEESEVILVPELFTDYQFPLQCLMFTVAGIECSIPLINLGSVLSWGGRLTLLPDTPDWFLGLLKHREINVKVADTAKILKINSIQQQSLDNRHILVFGDESWAITCDKLGQVIQLNEEDVKWSTQESKGVSLGTIKKSLAMLLSPKKILKQLNMPQDSYIV